MNLLKLAALLLVIAGLLFVLVHLAPYLLGALALFGCYKLVQVLQEPRDPPPRRRR